MLVLGIFAGVILGIVFVKAFMGASGAAATAPDPEAAAMVIERIRPIGRVALMGDPDVGVRPLIATDSQAMGVPLSSRAV